MKQEKARGVENLVLQMAQRGQITEKVGMLPLGCLTVALQQSMKSVRQCCKSVTTLPVSSIYPEPGCSMHHVQVSEERLIGLLEQIGHQAASKGQTKVTMQRRRTAWDDDD